jgi:hypothetical protein
MSPEMCERIREAQVQVANSAITSPGVYPVWSELLSAAIALNEAKARLVLAQFQWNNLISHATANYKRIWARSKDKKRLDTLLAGGTK